MKVLGLLVEGVLVLFLDNERYLKIRHTEVRGISAFSKMSSCRIIIVLMRYFHHRQEGDKVSWLLISVVISTMIYIGLTKNVKIKHEIKLFLRNNLNDGNERLWAFIITVIYCGPMLLTVFAVSDKLLSLDSILIQILLGIIGFIVCLFLIKLLLDSYFKLSKKSYHDITEARWQRQTKKLGAMTAVVAALAEEIFFRIFLPTYFILIDVPQSMSLIIASIFFTLLQLIYVETTMQRIVLGIGSFTISIVTISLIYFLNFYVSAIVTHVLFVYFFIKGKEEKNDFTGSKYQQNI